MGDQSKGGWSRRAQDALEADVPPVEPLEPERLPFLDRPLGYVTVRWAVVVGGMFVGAVVAVAVVESAVSDTFGFFIAPAGLIGALLGGLATGLVLYLRERFADRTAVR
jgi:hypothetical protein